MWDWTFNDYEYELRILGDYLFSVNGRKLVERFLVRNLPQTDKLIQSGSLPIMGSLPLQISRV